MGGGGLVLALGILTYKALPYLVFGLPAAVGFRAMARRRGYGGWPARLSWLLPALVLPIAGDGLAWLLPHVGLAGPDLGEVGRWLVLPALLIGWTLAGLHVGWWSGRQRPEERGRAFSAVFTAWMVVPVVLGLVASDLAPGGWFDVLGLRLLPSVYGAGVLWTGFAMADGRPGTRGRVVLWAWLVAWLAVLLVSFLLM